MAETRLRHAARMFVMVAGLSVPFFTIVLRKGYGLGAQAMAGGSLKAPFFTVTWPTGEFGGMGLEGAVKLGFRKELASAIFEWIEAWYNPHRRHTSIGYLSPVDYERLYIYRGHEGDFRSHHTRSPEA